MRRWLLIVSVAALAGCAGAESEPAVGGPEPVDADAGPRPSDYVIPTETWDEAEAEVAREVRVERLDRGETTGCGFGWWDTDAVDGPLGGDPAIYCGPYVDDEDEAWVRVALDRPFGFELDEDEILEWGIHGLPPAPLEVTSFGASVVDGVPPEIRALVRRDGAVRTLAESERDLLDPVLVDAADTVTLLVTDTYRDAPEQLVTACWFGWLGGRTLPPTDTEPARDAAATALCRAIDGAGEESAEYWAEVPVSQNERRLTVRDDRIELDRVRR